MLALNWNLFEGMKTDARVEEQRANVMRSSAQYRDAKLRIRQEVADAHIQVLKNHDSVKLSQSLADAAKEKEYFDALYSNEVNMSNFASLVIELLIVIPFVASRIVLLYKPAVELIERYRPMFSNFSIFVILFYLFGLQSTQNLNDILDFEPELIWISLVAVAGFYLLTILSALWVFNLHSPKEKAAFWHTVTRYITLALLISTFSIDTFGVSMILPVMFAYIIQIPTAIFLEKRIRSVSQE
jgi:hypothetical protein